jgi:hypothetical protein
MRCAIPSAPARSQSRWPTPHYSNPTDKDTDACNNHESLARRLDAGADHPVLRRHGAAPALDCKQLSKTAAKGSWVEANGIATEFSATGSSAIRIARLSFSNPVATDMVHATMNGVGARELALVEFQDAQGGWHKAWEGHLQPSAPGFEQTCFETPLPQKQVVQALRYTFRAGPGQVELNHAALLRRLRASEQDQIIPMHQLGRLDITENRLDLG